MRPLSAALLLAGLARPVCVFAQQPAAAQPTAAPAARPHPVKKPHPAAQARAGGASPASPLPSSTRHATPDLHRGAAASADSAISADDPGEEDARPPH